MSALEVMTSCLARIEKLNPQVNAICTLIPREDALSRADGCDMGGSIRNPAAFCNVVGFRPSVGRMPSWQLARALERMLPYARRLPDMLSTWHQYSLDLKTAYDNKRR